MNGKPCTGVEVSPDGQAGSRLPDNLLEAKGVSLSFGGVEALKAVAFQIRRGEIFSIIGPNGAGKTSLLNVISGLYVPNEGRIVLNDVDCTRRRPQALARLGLSRTFQNLALFRGMSVLENILMGRHVHMKSGLLAAGLFWGPARREEIAHRRNVERIIEFLEIAHIRATQVETLPFGLQKRVELGRALAAEPKLLLLDEPMAGMNRHEKRNMVRLIREVNTKLGTTIILIEHDMGVIMDISHRVMVLDHGEKIAEGTPEEIQSNPRVIKAYLGEEE